jgi:hypothetical protein
MSLAADKYWIHGHQAAIGRRCLVGLTGKDGYLRVLHAFHNLVQWLLRVAMLELGACATFWLLKLQEAPIETGSLSPVTIHHWIAYVGMFGFLISELLYELQSIVQRITVIRASWRKR